MLPYLDIPLQHISDRILKAMNRHIDRAATLELLDKLRARIPGLTLRTTFIVGFPGETDADFAELCDFIRKYRFDRLGVFPYAAEAATPAAKFPDQVSPEVAETRARTVMRRQVERMKRANRRRIGSEATVLVDAVDSDGVAVARGAADAPDIDNVVLIPNARKLCPGETVKVRFTGCAGCDMIAETVRKHPAARNSKRR